MIDKGPPSDKNTEGTRIGAPVDSGDVVEIRSGFDFPETIDRLRGVIATKGLTIFAEYDHAANAESAGLDMPPATVLVFGNARGGTPLMLKAPALALDLPTRILVREAPDGVVVSYHDPAATLAAFGLPASDAAPLQVVTAIAGSVARG
jgi:uncharacterized protein (DUF302 family)